MAPANEKQQAQPGNATAGRSSPGWRTKHSE